MHDIKLIRDNPDAFDKALLRRGLKDVSKPILEKDIEHRKVIQELQDLQQKRNELSKSVGQLKAKGENADAVMAEVSVLKDRMAELEEQERLLGVHVQDMICRIPNVLFDDVPEGTGEADNKQLKLWGDKPSFDFTPKQHFELGEALGQMHFEAATKISGSRFLFLSGDLAKLERAISQLMLDVTTAAGFIEMAPPFLVKQNAMYGTGQLPKFEEDLFKTTTDHYLIPTSEVPLTNFFHDQIIEGEKLPIRMTALTPCFRSEAGSAGRDTRGMIRVHQFNKVEVVSIVTPDASNDEQEFMAGIEESILQKLGLHYRKLILCSADTGGTMHRTFDMEVWLPGQNAFREISSCSNAGEYQARRMNTRFRDENKKIRFVHTLNGSALAVGRTLVAILENYQNKDGSVRVPEALVSYMGGKTVIEPSKALIND